MSTPPVQDKTRGAAGLSALAGRRRRGLLLAVAIVLAVVFVAENQTDMTTSFVFVTVTAKLWVGLLVCRCVGCADRLRGASALNRSRRS